MKYKHVHVEVSQSAPLYIFGIAPDDRGIVALEYGPGTLAFQVSQSASLYRSGIAPHGRGTVSATVR